MENPPGFDTPALRIPFRLRGHECEATFYYGVNEDPKMWGFDLLRLPFDIARTKGFPVFLAETRSAGAGYRAVMGWTQIVTHTPHDTRIPDTSIDMAPVEDDATFPATFSYEPRLFDAPGPNPPREHERWEAETYLLVCPDVGRTRRAVAVLGVRWGYVLTHGAVSVLPLTVASEADWQRHLPPYRAAFPAWQFEEGFYKDRPD